MAYPTIPIVIPEMMMFLLPKAPAITGTNGGEKHERDGQQDGNTHQGIL